jgi:hypothetical protein
VSSKNTQTICGKSSPSCVDASIEAPHRLGGLFATYSDASSAATGLWRKLASSRH